MLGYRSTAGAETKAEQKIHRRNQLSSVKWSVALRGIPRKRRNTGRTGCYREDKREGMVLD